MVKKKKQNDRMAYTSAQGLRVITEKDLTERQKKESVKLGKQIKSS